MGSYSTGSVDYKYLSCYNSITTRRKSVLLVATSNTEDGERWKNAISSVLVNEMGYGFYYITPVLLPPISNEKFHFCITRYEITIA